MASESIFRTVQGTDDVLVGAGVGTYTPRMVTVYGALDLDFAFVDLEHDGPSPFNSDALGALSQAADEADISLVVRLPSGTAETHPSRIRSALDAGVENILLPRVETAAEVRAAVAASRFRYDGEAGARGIGASRVTTYGLSIDEDFPDREDTSTTVGVVVETEPALENLDEILSVPGLGPVAPGPVDLAGSLGHPARPEHQDVQAAIDDIETATADAGVPLATLFVPDGEVRAFLDRGYQVLTVGSEISAVSSAFARALASAEEYTDTEGS